jgi:hypothetical protein
MTAHRQPPIPNSIADHIADRGYDADGESKWSKDSEEHGSEAGAKDSITRKKKSAMTYSVVRKRKRMHRRDNNERRCHPLKINLRDVGLISSAEFDKIQNNSASSSQDEGNRYMSSISLPLTQYFDDYTVQVNQVLFENDVLFPVEQIDELSSCSTLAKDSTWLDSQTDEQRTHPAVICASHAWHPHAWVNSYKPSTFEPTFVHTVRQC